MRYIGDSTSPSGMIAVPTDRSNVLPGENDTDGTVGTHVSLDDAV